MKSVLYAIVVLVIATVSMKTIIGNSAGPITLAITAAVIGIALPVCLLLVVRVNTSLRLFIGKFVTPAWRLVNQPISFGHVMAFPASFRFGAAGKGKAHTSRQS